MAHLEGFAQSVYQAKYSMEGKEDWPDTAQRVASSILGPVFPEYVEPVKDLIEQRIFMPGGRYLYAAGRKRQAVNNCLLMRATDSREGWSELAHNATSALMLGAGIGVDYSDVREDGAYISGLGGRATGPLALMRMVNEIGRNVMQGGSRRSAIWAGLRWDHPDALEFISAKDWPEYIAEAKRLDYNAVAPLDMTNISILLDDEFFQAYQMPNHPQHDLAKKIYRTSVSNMLTTGEPGFSVDTGRNKGETLRNACTEVTSYDDSDVCNLGSIVLPRIKGPTHMRKVVNLATAFLVAGNVVSDLPYEKVYSVRSKNSRIGLGLMGFAEWFAVRGLRYGETSPQLDELLMEYAASGHLANIHADQARINRPVKTRAIAPTGTISIIAETTSGIEPVFAGAYERTWLREGKEWVTETVVDAAVERMVAKGANPADIEDSYDLAREPERRLAFQAYVQRFVDHGISSTLNLPSTERQSFTALEFGRMLMKYLPALRGMTVYPDGARGGQPLKRVELTEALGVGHAQEEVSNEHACVNGVCGL